MLFVVTGADRVTNLSSRKERFVEYMMSLHRIFSYGFPVVGVLSEVDSSIDENCPPFSRFPFTILKTLKYGDLNGYTKSQREFMSITQLIPTMNNIEIRDADFVIKISGRYMLVNNSFVDTVAKHQSNPRVNAVVRLCDQDTQQYTFLYAMRYTYFKKFYSQLPSILDGNINIEKVILDFLKHSGLFDTTVVVESLGILANINNENTYTVY
jgi:hypothetical protein